MTDIGIIGMEVYFPNTYVDQEELEVAYGVGKGKHTIGLGQHKMAFASDREDINSIAMTVLSNLVNNYGIDWKDIGRLEIGTETLIDKSKSTKTCLMELFKNSGNHDVEGVTTYNACYGGTNALFNTLNWIESSAWDGRYGVVIAADLAVYSKGNARATGGAGAVAMLIGENAPLVIESSIRSSFMDNQYDFYKPDPNSEYPTVDGVLSQNTYLNALTKCYAGIKSKSLAHGKEDISLKDTDYFCFHSPYSKLVQKAFAQLYVEDLNQGVLTPSPELQEKIEETKGNFKDKALNKLVTKESKTLWNEKTNKSLHLGQNCGNSYTGSLYFCLMSLICDPTVDLTDKRVLLFSYGSGCASSMFTIRGKAEYTQIRDTSDFHDRLDNRIKKSPEFYEEIMAEREANYGTHSSFVPSGPIEELLPGTYYLTGIDDKWRREYSKVPSMTKSISVRPSPMISFTSTNSKLFELSKM